MATYSHRATACAVDRSQFNPTCRQAVLAAAAITPEMELMDGTLVMFEKLRSISSPASRRS